MPTLINAMIMDAFVKKALTMEKHGANSTYMVAEA
jgi:hypothetical protein